MRAEELKNHHRSLQFKGFDGKPSQHKNNRMLNAQCDVHRPPVLHSRAHSDPTCLAKAHAIGSLMVGGYIGVPAGMDVCAQNITWAPFGSMTSAKILHRSRNRSAPQRADCQSGKAASCLKWDSMAKQHSQALTCCTQLMCMCTTYA